MPNTVHRRQCALNRSCCAGSLGIANGAKNAVSNSYLDVLLMLGFGIVGYLFKKLSYPLAPLVLAIVIGDKAEDAFRQAMLMSKGSLAIFFSNALVATLVVGGIALLLLPLILQVLHVRTTKPVLD